jgi:hypothetical protein
MPAVSKPQFRAMAAAKAGNSTLGIPASVGADFVAATPNPGKLPAGHKKPPATKKRAGGQFHLKR